MKKNCYKLIEPIFKLVPVDMNILKPLLFTLANCCDQNDYQLIFWCDDFVSKITQRLFACLLDTIGMIEKNSEEKIAKLGELELYLIFLSRAVRGCGKTNFDF
jgi:hypothetical protein